MFTGNYMTAKQLKNESQKLICDKVEALALVRISHVRFGLTTVYLDFVSEKVAAESFDFLKSLGFKVKYYFSSGQKRYRPTKSLRVSWE
jgi:hypothetical protein